MKSEVRTQKSELRSQTGFPLLQSAICVLISAFVLTGSVSLAQATGRFQIARLEYGGGGDWYNDPDAAPNLCRELNRRTNIKAGEDEAQVRLTDDKLYNYPFLFATGHGNVSFTEDEVKRLRHFLESGGFLYADDDYGMDESFRREMKKVLPQSELVELPFDHPIYHQLYDFDKGPPKIHEHYEGAPQGFGMYSGGRMVVYYTYNSNVSDGWTQAHNDPPEVREQAFRMGMNIVSFFLTN